jgi:hypothetical protein
MDGVTASALQRLVAMHVQDADPPNPLQLFLSSFNEVLLSTGPMFLPLSSPQARGDFADLAVQVPRAAESLLMPQLSDRSVPEADKRRWAERAGGLASLKIDLLSTQGDPTSLPMALGAARLSPLSTTNALNAWAADGAHPDVLWTSEQLMAAFAASTGRVRSSHDGSRIRILGPEETLTEFERLLRHPLLTDDLASYACRTWEALLLQTPTVYGEKRSLVREAFARCALVADLVLGDHPEFPRDLANLAVRNLLDPTVDAEALPVAVASVALDPATLRLGGPWQRLLDRAAAERPSTRTARVWVHPLVDSMSPPISRHVNTTLSYVRPDSHATLLRHVLADDARGEYTRYVWDAMRVHAADLVPLRGDAAVEVLSAFERPEFRLGTSASVKDMLALLAVAAMSVTVASAEARRNMVADRVPDWAVPFVSHVPGGERWLPVNSVTSNGVAFAMRAWSRFPSVSGHDAREVNASAAPWFVDRAINHPKASVRAAAARVLPLTADQLTRLVDDVPSVAKIAGTRFCDHLGD